VFIFSLYKYYNIILRNFQVCLFLLLIFNTASGAEQILLVICSCEYLFKINKSAKKSKRRRQNKDLGAGSPHLRDFQSTSEKRAYIAKSIKGPDPIN
jgi:hypothetical protein